MAQAYGVLGSRLFVSLGAIASTIDSEQEFAGIVNWTEVGLVESFGEFGRVFDPVSFQAIADGRTYKLKGGYNDGSMQVTVGQDLDDSGQAVLSTAANLSNQNNYGFKVELNNQMTLVGGPAIYFFRGLVMSFDTQIGSVNNVAKSVVNVEVNSTIIRTPPADLYDRFVSGSSSLTHYELFKGTDPQALLPLISSSLFSLTTGDSNTGYAADGTQAVGDTGYTTATDVIIVEAKIQLSAITNAGVFFGLTDQKTSLEMPIESSGVADGITTNASDAQGFMFDTRMTTDNIWLVGVQGNVDATSQNSGSAFVAATWIILRMEVALDLTTTFYINGTQVGTPMTFGVVTPVTLYPVIAINSFTTASRVALLDYFYVDGR